MAQHQPEVILDVALITWEPANTLNNFRARLGLRPSRNLISSMTKAQPSRRRGDSRLRHDVSAAISDEQNCRLWITGLPATCTVRQLLGCIRDAGPVFACDINNPCSSGPNIWETAAASLTFFSADAANRFLKRNTMNPFIVANHIAKVTRHRIRVGPNDANGRSRVLRIVGDQQIVRPDYLFRVAAKEWLIQFDTDYFEFVEDRTRGWNEITWAFGSYHAQAQFVCKAINQCFNGRAQAVYLADPCSQ